MVTLYVSFNPVTKRLFCTTGDADFSILLLAKLAEGFFMDPLACAGEAAIIEPRKLL